MIAQPVLLLAIAGAAAGVTILDDPITTATGWTLACKQPPVLTSPRNFVKIEMSLTLFV